MPDELRGSCLCGSVTYECGGPPRVALHCHCRSCQKTSGSGHTTILVVSADDLQVTGTLSFHQREADSGNTVTRGFCPACGSDIYSESSGHKGQIYLRASSLDDPNLAMPAMAIYADQAIAWDHMDEGLPRFPGMPQ